MRNWIDIVQEGSERITVRGIELPVLTNPTKSIFRQFIKTQGALRASAFWDGRLLVFPAMLATHGDIDDAFNQYPLLVMDETTVEYHFDTSFPSDDIEIFKEELLERLPHHRGLVRALGSGFNINFDDSSVEWEGSGDHDW